MSHPDDPQAIAAIRQGDIDRYRELIERYQHQAYAVAWSRLGDAALAEEAVQESFIRAFRYLGWLRDPARFAGWISRITRAVAINLGLRHRRELRRRERWALDPSVTDASSETLPGAESAPDPSAGVRTALADLPPRHREALVLHYLEGRTVQDAARALGTTEGAFKVRLHRARTALRIRLERDLESALGRLGPRRSLVPAVMSSGALKAALADPGGAGTGLLAGLGAAVAKLLPVPFLILLMPLVAVGIGFGAAEWTQRVERRNYRDPEGFRARLHDDARRLGFDRSVWIVLAVILLVAIPAWIGGGYGLLLAVAWPISAAHVAASLRQYRLDGLLARHIHAVTGFPLLLVLSGGLVWNLPGWLTGLAWGINFLALAIWPLRRPLRHDYNLFLRARAGLLPARDPSAPPRAPLPDRLRLAYARLLARELLVVAHRRRPEAVVLKLHPVAPGAFDWFGPWILPGDSTITLHADGRVEAHLGRADRRHLDRLSLGAGPGGAGPQPVGCETRVQSAVQASLDAFREGSDSAAALECLGQRPIEEIFKVDPTRTAAWRWQRGVAFVGIAFAVWMIATSSWRLTPPPERLTHLRPVELSWDQARMDFYQTGIDALARPHPRWEAMDRALFRSPLLPPPSWASEAAREHVRTNLLSWLPQFGPGTPGQVELILRSATSIAKALEFGWLETRDLAAVGITPDAVRAAALAWPPGVRARTLGLETIDVSGRDYSVLGTDLFLWRAVLLRHLGCLDLVDARDVASQIRAHQVLPGSPPASGRRPDLDRGSWQGFIATHGWEPIQETRDALALLDLLGALDVVDTEACIQGILRLHRGRGLFLAQLPAGTPFTRNRPRSTPAMDLIVHGDAHTTGAAWDSLRMLGALGRVPDLGAWQFRPQSRAQVLRNDDGGPRRIPSWDEIEAVLMQERATRALSQPPAPARVSPAESR